jgi:hypothetical protein
MMKTFTAATAVMLSVLFSAGCRSDAAQQAAPAGWPEELRNFSFVWTAEDGIDLSTGPTVPVRAYIESFFLGELTGSDKYLYPGFGGAVDEKLRPGESSPGPDWVGTQTNHLLSLDRSDSDVTAIGCMYTYNAASPHGQDKQGQDEYEAQAVPPGAPGAGITAFKVTLTAPPKPSGPSDPQTGSARTPFDDVFGGYKVTGYFGGYVSTKGPDSIWPEYQQSTDECIAKAPDPVERRKYLSTNYLSRSEFPTLPASPGWPEKPAS